MDISVPGQTEIELMRNRLKYIPEIAHEIETLLTKATRGTRDYTQLEKAYAVVQKAQSAPLADDTHLLQVWRGLERAKAWARQAILEIEAASLLRLNDLRAGAHTVPAGISRRWISGLWWVHITPAFHLPAFLVVIHEKEQVTGAFGVATSEETISTSITQTTFSSQQADEVERILHQLDVFDQGDGLSLERIPV